MGTDSESNPALSILIARRTIFRRYWDWAVSPRGRLLGLTSALLISGVVLDQPNQLETARMLLESYVIVSGISVIGKQVL